MLCGEGTLVMLRPFSEKIGDRLRTRCLCPLAASCNRGGEPAHPRVSSAGLSTGSHRSLRGRASTFLPFHVGDVPPSFPLPVGGVDDRW